MENPESKNLSFEAANIRKTTGNCALDSCVKIDIEYPRFLGNNNPVRKINRTLEVSIYNRIRIEEDSILLDPEYLLQRFIDQYFRTKADFAHLHYSNEFVVQAKVTALSQEIISVFVEAYTYTGGAHPMSYQEFFNFNPHTGDLIDLKTFIKNPDLEAQIEQLVRSQYNIPGSDPWAQHFLTDTFALPAQMGFTADGLKLIYSLYEILPYSAGFTRIVLGYDSLGQFLDQKLLQGLSHQLYRSDRLNGVIQ